MPYRNPFKIRASEHVGPASSELFLRLFGPNILTQEKLKNSNILERLFFIRSSPGGGKTTLLRLFTPSSLSTLYRLRSSEDLKELNRIMKDIGAINDNGIQVVGVSIPLSQTYSSLEDLDIDNKRKDRFLFALLNARIIISTLRSLSETYNLTMDDLRNITFNQPNKILPDFNEFSIISGEYLYNWALKIENSICESLDSISPELKVELKGHENIILDILRPPHILIDGKPINGKLVLLFDDFHKLTKRQRETMIKSLTELRLTYGVWIAERYQALDLESMINDVLNIQRDAPSFGRFEILTQEIDDEENKLISGAKLGRDYEYIHLENMWSNSQKNFEKNVMNIANLRLEIAEDLNLSHFEDFLESSLDDISYNNIYSKAIETIYNRIKEKIGNKSRYEEWMGTIERKEGTLREKTLDWRTLEIIIEREGGNKQQTLTDLTLPREELDRRNDPSIRPIAEFYIANEFRLPYYFGKAVFAQLASYNIEQFLLIAGEIFEEVKAKYRIKREASLTPKDQHDIIKRTADKKWEEIVNGISYTKQTKWLLEGIGKFSKKELSNPKASYLSVTGVGIKIRDLDQLNKSEGYKRLKYTLESCLANNLLEAREINQGGERNLVFYLNRLLCVKFSLPLFYGGWRHKKLNDLQSWMEGKD